MKRDIIKWEHPVGSESKGSILLVHGTAPMNIDGNIPICGSDYPLGSMYIYKKLSRVLVDGGWSTLRYTRDGVYDDSVLGAYQAMVAAGKDGEDIALIGFDAIEEALLKIEEGGIYRGTIDIAPFESGRVIIETAVKVLEKGPIEELIEFPVTKVTKENVDKFLGK